MKCKECKTKLLNCYDVYCNECVKKFKVTYAEAKKERQQDKIQCRICKKYFVVLACHTFAMHKLTGRQYRKMFGYDLGKGLIPEHYRQARRAQNKKNHACENLLEGGKATLFKKGYKCDYKRCPETVGRLLKQCDEVGPVSKETKRKMSIARKGTHPSKETKRKMSIARKKYWASRKEAK